VPTTLLEVAYRPVRVAWLVRGRSKNDLRDALRIASCLWGGRFGLIADAGGEPEVVDTALARFRADVLHAVAESEATRSVIERNRHLAWRPQIADGIVSAEFEEPGLVDLSKALHLRGTNWTQTVVLPVWDEADELALVYGATFGDLTHPTLGSKQRAAFLRVTGAEEAPAAAIASARDDYLVPLDATTSGLTWVTSELDLREAVGVFVGLPSSLTHARAYWNTRATGTEAVFWDSRDPDGGPFRPAVDAGLAAAAASQENLPDNFRYFPCYVPARTIEDRPELPTALRRLIGDAGLLPIVTPVVGDVGIATSIRPGTLGLATMPGEHVVAHTEDRGDDRSRVTIELPRTPLADFERWSPQELAIQIETYVDSGYRGTLKLPYLPDLNPWYRRHISGALEPVRVQYKAFALIKTMLGPTLELTPLSPRLLLEELFARAGIEASRSLPGEAAWHLLLQFGSYAGLRVLRLPGVRKLLASTAARSGIRRKAARDLIHDRGSINDAAAIWFGGEQLDATRVWESLLQRRIFLPGFETKCPWCQHSSFYRPRDVEDELQCPKCGRNFALGPAIAGDPVRFRMSGLLEPRSDNGRNSRDGDRQPGAVPVLLTLLFFSEWTRAHDGALLDTSHELSGDGIENCETDFVAVTYGARPEPHTHILIGECKGRGRVSAEDVRKLSAVATRIRESGDVECDVVFATTRDAFDEEERALFRQYYEESSAWEWLRRAPILLTADALDFHAYDSRSPVSTGPSVGETGFGSLVSWSTRTLIGPPVVPG
jgi:hypothetical protein